ncbi:MAG TPA: oxidoreductase [Pseudonocardiaceae bacterium]|jgi:protochlorophyllide reductase
MAKWTADDIPDQNGRAVLVTGANSGLGLHMSRALVAKGARVLMACRSPERGEAAVVEVNEVAKDDGVAELVVLDLADLASVRAAAAEVRERTGDTLDVLINNAGVMATPQRTTTDGFELQLGTNHIGHAALTWLVMPALRRGDQDAAPPARVVTVSSLLHQRGGLDVTDLNFQRRSYHGWTAYSQSKIANLLFAFELDRRARAAGLNLISVAAHPGLSDTELASNMMLSRGSALLAQVADFFNGLIAQPAEHGTWPLLYAATAPDVVGGQFYGPDGFQQMRGHPTLVRASRQATDPGTAARVWELTAGMSQVTPDPA